MSVEMSIMKQASEKRKGNFIRLRMWFGGYKQAAQVKTCQTLIKNMMNGVVEVSSSFNLSHRPEHCVGCRSACQFN
jgi:ribosomal protein L6P/L9E